MIDFYTKTLGMLSNRAVNGYLKEVQNMSGKAEHEFNELYVLSVIQAEVNGRIEAQLKAAVAPAMDGLRKEGF